MYQKTKFNSSYCLGNNYFTISVRCLIISLDIKESLQYQQHQQFYIYTCFEVIQQYQLKVSISPLLGIEASYVTAALVIDA